MSISLVLSMFAFVILAQVILFIDMAVNGEGAFKRHLLLVTVIFVGLGIYTGGLSAFVVAFFPFAAYLQCRSFDKKLAEPQEELPPTT